MLAAQSPDPIRTADQRVFEIGYRLQTRNASICPQTSRLAGFGVQSTDQFADAVREEAVSRFHLTDFPQVSAVASGSDAERLGIKVGDEVRAVDGEAIVGNASS